MRIRQGAIAGPYSRPASKKLPKLQFDYPPTPFVVKSTGHVIEGTMPAASNLTLTVGGDQYRLVRFEFHAPSEHTLDSKSYSAEVHLVQRSADGGLAIVAILLEPSGLPSTFIQHVVASAPGGDGEEVEFDEGLSPLELFLDFAPRRAAVDSYYAYQGSLTMPPCTEGVRWFVFRDIYVVRLATLDRLHDLIGDFPNYDGYRNNNRPTQPLGNRTIDRS